MWWSKYYWIGTNYKQSKMTRILLMIAYFLDGVDIKAWRKKQGYPSVRQDWF